MREILMFTDAAKGKPVGGMGIVLVEETSGGLYYEYEQPTIPNLSQSQAELYAILAGIGQVKAVLSSHGVRPRDVYLSIYTDCEQAVNAISFPEKVRSKTTRLLIKRIIKALTKSHFCPKGGGAGYHHIGSRARKTDSEKTKRLREYLKRAHSLSRHVRSQFKNLL